MAEGNKKRSRHRRDRPYRRSPRIDEKVQDSIKRAETFFQNPDILEPMVVEGLNGFQRKQLYEYFEKFKEYKVKSYRETDSTIVKIYPVGKLKRFAEQKMQEVLMKGKSEILPPMGAFERFIIHDYLKEREGVKTESKGEPGKDRRIEILPVFGRGLKKAKPKRML